MDTTRSYQQVARLQAARYRRHAAALASNAGAADLIPAALVLAATMTPAPAVDHTARRNATRRAATADRHNATCKAQAAAWGH